MATSETAVGVEPGSLIDAQTVTVQEVSVDQLRIGQPVAIRNTLDPDFLAEGTVLSVPEKAPEDETPAYLGSILVRQYGTTTTVYPDGHPQAGETVEREKPTLVVPVGEYNDHQRPWTDGNGERHAFTVGRYKILAFVSA